jgi:hypothetical protein
MVVGFWDEKGTKGECILNFDRDDHSLKVASKSR